jgi:peptide/nickel transport system substrate-binding protein
MMPERQAKTPASEQVKEFVGSGPFRFLPGEWVSGASAAWTKFDKYVPRQEAPSTLAGGKVAYVDRVEWVVQPDPATAVAALRKGEVDWIEWPLTDLLPQLKASPGVVVKALNWPHFCVLALNHLHPPFDNPAFRRALLPAIDQKAFVEAIVGDQMELTRVPCGYFTEGTPMANKAGLEALTGPRDLALARRLVAESGYKGEPVLVMSPTDSPPFAALAHVVHSTLQSIGVNVDFREMDFGSLMTRRVNQAAPGAGGWNAVAQIWTVLNSANPGNALALRANGKGAAFGWPTDPELETLRQEWFDAPDLATQLAAAERIQRRAFEFVPGIPLGQVTMPTAYRDNITGIVRTPYPAFWGLKKG